jgi:hypothetical protein
MKPGTHRVPERVTGALLAKAIVEDYLRRLRNQFYPDDDKRFFQQRALLVRGITHLAVYLRDRDVALPERRYRQILDEIIQRIQHFGDTSRIEYFCRYWLKAVQSHVDHHGEDYYEEAKDFRHALDHITSRLSPAAEAKCEEAREDTVDHLAEIAKLIRGGRPKKQLPAKPADPAPRPADSGQLSLF